MWRSRGPQPESSSDRFFAAFTAFLIALYLYRLRDELLLDHRRRGDRNIVAFIFLRVDVTGDQITQTRLVGLHLLIGTQELGDRIRVLGQCQQHLALSALDALGDLDLALAGEQLDGAHLAHVHAHGVGGATELAVHAGQSGSGLFGHIVVAVHRRIVHQQTFGIRRKFMHRNTHVIDHADDIFYLLRIDDIVGQMIIDLPIGQVALFLAFGD